MTTPTTRTNTAIIEDKKLEGINKQLISIRGTKSTLEKMYDDLQGQVKKIMEPLADDMEDTKEFLFTTTKVLVTDTSRVDVDGMREYLVKHEVPAGVIEAAVKAATKPGRTYRVSARTDLPKEDE